MVSRPCRPGRVRLRTPGKRLPLVPVATAASSTRFDRLPSRHAPTWAIRCVTDRAERTGGESIAFSRFPAIDAVCFERTPALSGTAASRSHASDEPGRERPVRDAIREGGKSGPQAPMRWRRRCRHRCPVLLVTDTIRRLWHGSSKATASRQYTPEGPIFSASARMIFTRATARPRRSLGEGGRVSNREPRRGSSDAWRPIRNGSRKPRAHLCAAACRP